jgi:hypothetical protein
MSTKTINPFGGKQSLSRLDLLDKIDTNQVCGEKLLFLSVIRDAVQQYLFFGLGKNGTTAEGFVESCNYFFKVRSNDQSTWYTNKYRLQILDGCESKREVKVMKLSDTHLRMCCFDTHFQHSGLEKFISMDRFLKHLKYERQTILLTNFSQVEKFINDSTETEVKRVEVGTQLPLKVTTMNIVGILTCPDGLGQIAKLLLLSKHLQPPRRIRASKNKSKR